MALLQDTYAEQGVICSGNVNAQDVISPKILLVKEPIPGKDQGPIPFNMHYLPEDEVYSAPDNFSITEDKITFKKEGIYYIACYLYLMSSKETQNLRRLSAYLNKDSQNPTRIAFINGRSTLNFAFFFKENDVLSFDRGPWTPDVEEDEYVFEFYNAKHTANISIVKLG